MKTWQRCGSNAADDAVILELVVARGDPDLAPMSDPDLRRAQHVPCRMKRDLDAVADQRLAVIDGLDRDIAEAFLQDRRAVAMADVELRAEAGMVAVGMGDQRARDRPPRVDMKVARGAIEAAIGRNDEVHGDKTAGDAPPALSYRDWPAARHARAQEARGYEVGMPTVLQVDGLRFFFYSLENSEPPHIHVEINENTAKFWLNPVQLARSDGFRPQELTRLRALVIEHRLKLLEAWNAYFGR